MLVVAVSRDTARAEGCMYSSYESARQPRETQLFNARLILSLDHLASRPLSLVLIL